MSGAIELVEETHEHVVVRVKKPSTRHLDEFLRLDAAPALLAEKLFPNAKEITESMAALAALRRTLGPGTFKDPKVLLLDVGAGKRPRTAALLAFMTKWRAIAIDPELDLERLPPFERLEGKKTRIEHAGIAHDGPVVVTLVHAHVKPRKVLRFVAAPEVWVVGLPCCVPMELGPDDDATLVHEHEDLGIWSPSRVVRVWRLGPNRPRPAP